MRGKLSKSSLQQSVRASESKETVLTTNDEMAMFNQLHNTPFKELKEMLECGDTARIANGKGEVLQKSRLTSNLRKLDHDN